MPLVPFLGILLLSESTFEKKGMGGEESMCSTLYFRAVVIVPQNWLHSPNNFYFFIPPPPPLFFLSLITDNLAAEICFFMV